VWDGEKPAHARTDGPDGQSLIGFHSPIDKSHALEGKRLIENFKIRALGSGTLHLAYTAIGLLNGVVDHNNKIWDIAAAVALVEEGGGRIQYLTRSPFPMKEFTPTSERIQYVAGNAAVVAKLREVLGR
jgi:myo-inositol-1(or 4)-monophosphatase